MKTLRTLALAAAFFAAVLNQGTAFAEDIGGGSIRITAAPESGAEIKIRYLTEDGTVEKSLTGTEVLHLSSFDVTDNGDEFPILLPTFNQFSLYKSETTGFILMGNEENMVRLNFEQEGISVSLKLDFQWFPKLEILTGAADKVEVLNDADEVLHEVGEEALALSAANGMAIRFVVPDTGDQGGNPDENQDPTDDGNDVAPEAGATGGCSLTPNLSGGLNGAWLFLLPAAFAMVRRFRRK